MKTPCKILYGGSFLTRPVSLSFHNSDICYAYSISCRNKALRIIKTIQ